MFPPTVIRVEFFGDPNLGEDVDRLCPLQEVYKVMAATAARKARFRTKRGFPRTNCVNWFDLLGKGMRWRRAAE
jgi:hypothetical protein